MALEQLSPNNPTPSTTFATLSSGINNSVTSLTVSSASFFPSVGQFRILIDNEYMLVTAVSGTTLTVTRGAEGSVAASHLSGVKVSGILTKDSLTQIVTDAFPFTVVRSSGHGLTGVALQAGGMTSGSATLTLTGVSGTSTFSASDVGKAIQVVGAGASGADLYTTIASFTSSTSVDLSATASTTVVRKTVLWYPVGQNDTTAIQAAMNALTRDNGILCLPDSLYIISSALTASQFLLGVVGGGINNSYVAVSSAAFTGDMLDMSSARGYRIQDISFKHAGLAATTARSNITAWSITSNVVTLTGTNTFAIGQAISMSGFIGTASFLNDQFVTITAASGVDFSFSFTHANGSGTDPGVAYLDYNCIAFPVTTSTLLYSDFSNAQFMCAPGCGLKFDLSVVCRFDGCVFLSNRAHGVALYNSQNIGSTSTVWTNCYSNGNGLSGYYLHIVNYSSFRTCAADSNGTSYYLYNCKNVTLEGCGSEATLNQGSAYPGYDYYFHGGQGNILDGCYASKNSGAANAAGTYVVFDNTASQSTIRNPTFAGAIGQLPTNTFSIASGCVDITIWEPYFSNNLSTAYSDAGTTSTIYIDGAFKAGGSPAPYTTTNPLYLGAVASAANTGIIRSAKGTTTTYWYAGDGGATANIGIIGITAAGSLVFGDGTNGSNINFNVPSGSLVQFQSAGTNALAATIRAAGTTQLQFGSGVTAVNINQSSTSVASGANWSISAQSSSFSGGNGGQFTLASGSAGAGGTDGSVLINLGSTTFVTVAPTLTTFTQSLAIGATVAASGNVRVANATTIIAARNAANSTDIGVLFTDSSNNFGLGDGTNGADAWLSVKSGQLIRAKVASTDILTISGSLITAVQGIALGAGIVATTGALRAPNATTILYARNAANSADIALLGSTAGGSVVVGDGVNATNVNLNVPSAGLIQFQSAGNNALIFTLRDTGATTVQFASGVTSATINQANTAIASATGAALTIQAQNAVGTTSTGGALTLTSGTGTTAAGTLNLQAGGVTKLSVGPVDTTLSNANLLFPGTLGATANFRFASNASGAAGQALDIRAQNGASTFNGGNLKLSSGAAGAGGSDGLIQLGTNGTAGVFIFTPSAGASIYSVVAGATSSAFTQANNTTNGATGATTTVQAQNATGTTATGGALVLTSGTGTTAPGKLRLQAGGADSLAVEASSNLVLGGSAGSYGGGAAVVSFLNRTTAPTGNPSGGLILYAEGGDLVSRSSSGSVQSVTGGLATRAFPSDADYTAVQADYQASTIEVSGTISAARAFILPATSGYQWTLYNNTTGGFPVVFKASGQTGVSVASKQRVHVYTNGTDVVPIGAAFGTTVSAWTAIYDSDWSSLATSVASANGNFTVDGRTWTIANFANSQTFQITNGTGLIIKCNANNTDWTTPTDTLAKISITLANLLSGFTLDPSWAIRISVQIAVTATTAFEGAVFSYGLASGFNQDFYFIKGVRSAVSTIQYGGNPNAATSNINDTTNLTDDVFQIQVDSFNDDRARMYSGLYSSGWPALGALRTRGILRQSTTIFTQPSMTLTSDPAIMLGIKSTNTAAVAQLTVKRLRVEIRP